MSSGMQENSWRCSNPQGDFCFNSSHEYLLFPEATAGCCHLGVTIDDLATSKALVQPGVELSVVIVS